MNFCKLLTALFIAVSAAAPASRPAYAVSYGFTPNASLINLPSGGSGSVSLSLLIPAGQAFTIFHNLPPSTAVSVSPASGVSDGNPVTITVSVTSYAAGVRLVNLIAHTDNATYNGFVTVFTPVASDIQIAPGPSTIGILNTRQHTFTLTNLASYAQLASIQFAPSQQNWPTSVSPLSVNLPPGGSAQVVVSTTRPLTAVAPHTVTVFAAATGGGTASSAVTFRHYRAALPVVSWPGPDLSDAYEPDDSCAQFSQLALGQTQTRTMGGGSSVDIIRMILPGPGNYTLGLVGQGYRAQPVMRVWTQQTCGVGASQTYTSAGGWPTSAPIVLPPAPPYSWTFWISVTNALGPGPGTGYQISVTTASTAFAASDQSIIVSPD